MMHITSKYNLLGQPMDQSMVDLWLTTWTRPWVTLNAMEYTMVGTMGPWTIPWSIPRGLDVEHTMVNHGWVRGVPHGLSKLCRAPLDLHHPS